MIKIVFIVFGTESAGELTIALEFARRLPPDRCDMTFMIPGKFAFYFQDKRFHLHTLDPKKGKANNREKILNLFNTLKPHMIVMSDPFTMEHAASWSGVRFDRLKELGIPILGVDEFEYSSTGYRLDYYGAMVKILPPMVGECDISLRNCPLNTPRTANTRTIKNYSFIGETKKMSRETRQQAREKLGIDEDEKMIFFATSKWESMNPHKIIPLFSFLKWRPLIFEQYLNRLKGKIALVHVGQETLNIDTGRFKYIKLQNVPPSDYEHSLLSADLFITFNIVSVTLSRAVFGEVPSLVVQNDKIINFGKLQERLKQMPGWYQKMAGEMKKAYPFKASSFGWHDFLKPVLKDNDYMNTFKRTSFFKMDETVNAIESLLFDNNAVTEMKEKQRQYVDSVLGLPSPGEVIEEIVTENNLMSGH